MPNSIRWTEQKVANIEQAQAFYIEVQMHEHHFEFVSRYIISLYSSWEMLNWQFFNLQALCLAIYC